MRFLHPLVHCNPEGFDQLGDRFGPPGDELGQSAGGLSEILRVRYAGEKLHMRFVRCGWEKYRADTAALRGAPPEETRQQQR